MGDFRPLVIGTGTAIVVALVSLAFIAGPRAQPQPGRTVPEGTLLRVPVTGVYPGGRPTSLNPNMQNPLANDPTAAQRGMKDFNTFNCVGCHADNGGGGMGPSLSNETWIYRSSPGNIYMTIVQGRSAGMPAFGAMLPDRTVWELVAYIESITEKPGPHFAVVKVVAEKIPLVLPPREGALLKARFRRALLGPKADLA